MEILYFGYWCRPFDQYWAVPVDNCKAQLPMLISIKADKLSSAMLNSYPSFSRKPGLQPVIGYNDTLHTNAHTYQTKHATHEVSLPSIDVLSFLLIAVTNLTTTCQQKSCTLCPVQSGDLRYRLLHTQQILLLHLAV